MASVIVNENWKMSVSSQKIPIDRALLYAFYT